MSVAPSLELPAGGRWISRHAIGYVKRDSAARQAAAWNNALADDPLFGPASGFVVGVGAPEGRRWPLVWVPVHGYGMRPEGFSPGYCWCGTWAYDQVSAAGVTPGCPGLAVALGRATTSHREAQALAQQLGMDWNGLDDWRPRAAGQPNG